MWLGVFPFLAHEIQSSVQHSPLHTSCTTPGQRAGMCSSQPSPESCDAQVGSQVLAHVVWLCVSHFLSHLDLSHESSQEATPQKKGGAGGESRVLI